MLHSQNITADKMRKTAFLAEKPKDSNKLTTRPENWQK